MAYAKFYKYNISSSGWQHSTLTNIGSYEIGSIDTPETKMSGISYFSIEGRQMTFELFLNETDALYDQLITNKQNNIHPVYNQLTIIFTKIYEDSKLLFSGMLSSSYNYDDYSKLFTNIKIYDGLHCFIKYHIERLSDLNIEEAFYSNIYPDKTITGAQYGQEVDIDNMSQKGYQKLKMYYNTLINGIIGGQELTPQLFYFYNKVNVDVFNNDFPMRIEGLESINFILQEVLGKHIDTTTDVLNDFFKSEHPIDKSFEQLSMSEVDERNMVWFDNTQYIPGEGYPYEQPFYLNDQGQLRRNNKFYYHKRQLWCKAYATIFEDGHIVVLSDYSQVAQHPDNIGDEQLDYKVVMKQVWYIKHLKHISPWPKVKMSQYYLNNPILAIYSALDIQKLNIIKFRFWIDGERSLWYAGHENKTYSYSGRIKPDPYQVGSLPIPIDDKMIDSMNGNIYSQLWDDMFEDVLYKYRVYVQYPNLVPNKDYLFDTTIVFRTHVSEDNITTIYKNWLQYDQINNLFRIYGQTILSKRALILNSNISLSDLIKSTLIVFNISIIPLANGNLRFIQRLKNIIDSSTTIHHLNDTNTRSIMKMQVLKNTVPEFSATFFYDDVVKNLATYFYHNIFRGFASQRQFTSFKYSFNTQPQINDIITYNNTQYWINSIKLSNNQYIIKAYEVLS